MIRTSLFASLTTMFVLVSADLGEDHRLFNEFKAIYNKGYGALEEEGRFQKFQGNLRMYEHRNLYFGARYSVDQWSDLSLEEFLEQQASCYSPEPTRHQLEGGVIYSPQEIAATARTIAAAAGTIDWRARGAVTPAKDQGAFGACWSFGASGVMEGINVAQANHSLTSLCEQELIDCCEECQGRGPDKSWAYLINNTKGYLDTEASYPYHGDVKKCQTATARVSDAKVSSYKIIHQDQTGNQDAILAEMIASGPCNIGVDAACLAGYTDGVITNCTGNGVDHANVIVGAGTAPASEGSVDYWIVKNSWGIGFGMEGFYKVARNTNQMAIDACFHAYV